MTITQERAIELIEEKRKQEAQKHIKQFDEEPEMQVLNGRYGPYISFKGKNYKIPKSKKPEELNLEECREIIEKADKKKK
jgi:DNA topoisomerase-1